MKHIPPKLARTELHAPVGAGFKPPVVRKVEQQGLE